MTHKSILLTNDTSKILLDEWQTVYTLIRYHILWYRIWAYTLTSDLFDLILGVMIIYSSRLGTFSMQNYHIRPNYRTYPYKRTVKKFRSLQITTSVLFSLLLYKGICCGYSFELHRQVDAIQMSTHNICLLYKGICCGYSFELHRHLLTFFQQK